MRRAGLLLLAAVIAASPTKPCIAFGLAALVFMSMSAAHLSILTRSRHPDFDGLGPVFTFRGGGLAAVTQRLLTLSGVLSMAGLSGMVEGDMALRNIGIAGYVGAFLAATMTLTIVFRGERW